MSVATRSRKPKPRRVPPAVELTEYQLAWIKDRSRFKQGMMARQTGKSFGTSLEAVLDIYDAEAEGKKDKWVFLSAGERQSKELNATATLHSRAMGMAVAEQTDQFRENDLVYKQLEIRFPGGSRIIALPANPATARGHAANILLDEFAFHKDSRAIWKALFFTITRGFKVRIVSTPQGKKNKFYDLWGNEKWSHHKVTLPDAVTRGLKLRDEEGNPTTPEELRLALGDDEAWAQEALCEFLDEVTAYITYDLISLCEEPTVEHEPAWAQALILEAQEAYKQVQGLPVAEQLELMGTLPVSLLPDELGAQGELYLGYDVARRRHLSVLWLDEQRETALWPAAVITLKGQPFFVQKRILWTLLSHPRLRRACIDATGLGMQTAEEAADLFGPKVEGIAFSVAHKEALAMGLKRNLEVMGSALPMDHTIRESFHAIKKYPTAAGHARFDAEATDKLGHGDHFWAKAMAVQAATIPTGPGFIGALPAFGA